MKRKKSLFLFIYVIYLLLPCSMAVFLGLMVNILGHHINFLQQLTIFIFMILPIYFSGNLAFEQYKSPYCKYMITEDKKVIILNEKYLKRKNRLSKFKKLIPFTARKNIMSARYHPISGWCLALSFELIDSFIYTCSIIGFLRVRSGIIVSVSFIFCFPYCHCHIGIYNAFFQE